MLTKNFARMWGVKCLLNSSTVPLTSINNIFYENMAIGVSGCFYILKQENLYLKDFDLVSTQDNLTKICATLMVGSSLQEESSLDINLIEPITDLTPISISNSFPNTNGITASSASYLYNINKTYKNETDKNIIVNEIGLFGNTSMNINGKITICRFLLGRKVLDTPIIFKPGDIYTISFNLDI